MNFKESLSQVSTQWIRYLRQSILEDEVARGLTIDKNGILYVTGQNHNYIGSGKYNSAGDLICSHFYNSTAHGTEETFDIVADESGNYYVVGFTRNANEYKDLMIVKYNSISEIIWFRTFNGPSNRDDEAFSVCLGDSGMIYVAGGSATSGTNTDCVTLKYDSSGNLIWNRYFLGENNIEFLNTVRVDDAGNVYVTGSSYNGSFGNDPTTIKYNSNGDLQWSIIHPNLGNGSIGMELDEFGNAYVGTQDFKLIKYSPTGTQIWIRQEVFDGQSSLADLEIDVEGNIIITGGHHQGNNTRDFYTLKYNPEGDLLWSVHYNNFDKDDFAKSVATDKYGNIYVTGDSRNLASNNWDYATVKYDKHGGEKWTKRYEGPNFADQVTKVVCDTSGNVYVTGTADPDFSSWRKDIVTLKYIQQVNRVLELTAFVQGFYDSGSGTMIKDSVKVYLRNTTSPFDVVDSCNGILNSAGKGIFEFPNAVNGTPYYIVVKHRNSLETWSAAGETFASNSLAYDFTTSAGKAYGDNMIQVNSSPVRFAIYSGDVNKDGAIEATDLSMIDNDAANFLTGYVQSDVNGDNVIDASDALITENNAGNFIVASNPLLGFSSTINQKSETILKRSNKFELKDNYPNPFNPGTVISYSLAANSNVSLKIFDITGREVLTLVDQMQNAGIYSVTFNASGLSSGMYFYKLNVNGYEQVKKMTLLK